MSYMESLHLSLFANSAYAYYTLCFLRDDCINLLRQVSEVRLIHIHIELYRFPIGRTFPVYVMADFSLFSPKTP